MECRTFPVYDCSRRSLNSRCVVGATTLSSSSSLSRRSHGHRSSSSCCGDRGLPVVSSSVPCCWSVVLCLVWIWLIVAVASPDLPRSRSRHHFRFLPPRSVSPPQDTPTTHHHHQSTQSRAETVEGRNAAAVAGLTVPVRRSTTRHPPPTTTGSPGRLSMRKILEGRDDEVLDRLIGRPQSRSQIETLPRPNAEVVASIRVKSVPVGVFRRRLSSARSYRDVIRIFIRSEERLRDEDIDDFIASPTPTSRQSIEDNSIPVNEWELAMNHLREMEEKGTCRQPIPKFIQIRHHELARPESNYVPECTVVYRCHKDYGCCNSTSECGVKSSTYIYRSFWELTCPPGSNCTEFNMPTVKTIRFVNHTECECKPVKQLPRCKLCPEPFEIVRREDFGRCNCTCHSDDQRCLSIENGRIPMETHQANCIRESNCERPHCQHGDYDITTGYCPCPEDTPECRNVSQGQGLNDEDDISRSNDVEASSTGLQTATDEQTTNEQHQTTNEQQTTRMQQTTNEQQAANRRQTTSATESNVQL